MTSSDHHQHPVPSDPRIAVLVAQFTSAAREAFEERAGIRQYDGGLARADAEREACLDVLAAQARKAACDPNLNPNHPAQLRVFQLMCADGGSQWVLVLDPAAAQDCLRDLGGHSITEADAAETLHAQFGGLAYLGTAAD